MNEKINDHAITVATCLANCWPVTEVPAFPSETVGWPRHHKKRACRRFQNDQAESIFFSVSRFCGFIDICNGQDSPETIARALFLSSLSLIHYLIEYLLNSSTFFVCFLHDNVYDVWFTVYPLRTIFHGRLYHVHC